MLAVLGVAFVLLFGLAAHTASPETWRFPRQPGDANLTKLNKLLFVR